MDTADENTGMNGTSAELPAGMSTSREGELVSLGRRLTLNAPPTRGCRRQAHFAFYWLPGQLVVLVSAAFHWREGFSLCQENLRLYPGIQSPRDMESSASIGVSYMSSASNVRPSSTLPPWMRCDRSAHRTASYCQRPPSAWARKAQLFTRQERAWKKARTEGAGRARCLSK